MPVNSYIFYGPDGVVVVDSMLTVADATSVRDAVRASGCTMAAVVVTHPHPDHYAGLDMSSATTTCRSSPPERSTRSSAGTTM
jgi:glyoxylase-like metal-dependent hydrolase (beta-lactamase superfamily II)